MTTGEQILFQLKTRGPQTAQQLAKQLQLTSMGVRRHLEAWQEKGLLLTEDRADKVGRPARYWLLSDAGHARFPDRHGDLAVQLIDQVRQLFGQAGLDRLILAREQQSEVVYQGALRQARSLGQRVAALAQARDAEGYMAEVQAQADGSFLLVENHCPICAAATACQGFCRSELAVFQRSVGEGGRVERAEHLLGGGRRCVYKITPI